MLKFQTGRFRYQHLHFLAVMDTAIIPTTSLDRNEAENTAPGLIFAYDDSSNKRDKMAPRHLKSLHACQVTL